MAVRTRFPVTPNGPWLFMYFLLSRGIPQTLLHKPRGPCDESYRRKGKPGIMTWTPRHRKRATAASCFGCCGWNEPGGPARERAGCWLAILTPPPAPPAWQDQILRLEVSERTASPAPVPADLWLCTPAQQAPGPQVNTAAHHNGSTDAQILGCF